MLCSGVYLAQWAARGPELSISLPFCRHPAPVDEHGMAPLLVHQRRDQHISAACRSANLPSGHALAFPSQQYPASTDDAALAKACTDLFKDPKLRHWPELRRNLHTSQRPPYHCLQCTSSTYSVLFTGSGWYPGLALPMMVRGRGPTKMLRSCCSSPWHHTRRYSGSASEAWLTATGSACTSPGC